MYRTHLNSVSSLPLPFSLLSPTISHSPFHLVNDLSPYFLSSFILLVSPYLEFLLQHPSML